MNKRYKYAVYYFGAFVAYTYAASPAQAINNVRHNKHGDYKSGANDNFSAELVE